jgi:hypothetical protein
LAFGAESPDCGYFIHVHVQVRVGGSIEILLDWSIAPDRSSTLGTVLSARRAAKRRLEDRSQPGSPDWVAAESETEHFQADYRRLARRNPASAL